MSRDLPFMDFVALESAVQAGAANDEVAKLHKALKDVGFIYLTQHGVSESLLYELMEIGKLFFNQGDDVKNTLHMKSSGASWRGYFSVGEELTSGKPDIKEGLYFGLDHESQHHHVVNGTPTFGKNLWPEGPLGLQMQSLVSGYMAAMKPVSQTLLSAISLGLGLESHYFQTRFSNDPTILFRMFHYPSTSKDANDWGVQEHTDMGFLTALLQDDSGGLEAKSTDGAWIKVPPIRGTLVINLGDMLEYWTHGVYRATPHRVKHHGRQGRLSMPFFFDPNWDATLEPIDLNLIQAHPRQHQDHQRWDQLDLLSLDASMTYGEFVWNKIKHVFPHFASSVKKE